jgi:SRSO17 transposase
MRLSPRLSRGIVLMDAGYGSDTDLSVSVTTLGLTYVAGIMPQTSVWAHPGRGHCQRRRGQIRVLVV